MDLNVIDQLPKDILPSDTGDIMAVQWNSTPAHPASYPMGTGSSFSSGKVAGA
jgi:hypothetical protein